MELRLDGKRVVLTAGGGGIGRVTLEPLFEAGRPARDLRRRSGGERPEVPAIPADVAREAGIPHDVKS
jgi:NAD(P)-dependent dehydrogenase (short-subunit alcohol dehydrogenase family)